MRIVRTGASSALSAMAVAMVLAGPAAPAAAQDPVEAGPEGPWFADVWIGGPVDSLYNAELTRLRNVCASPDRECFETELDTTPVVLTPVWEEPGGDPAGRLAAALRPRGRYPFVTLLLRPAHGPTTVVREDVGDWGYGVTLAVADRADDWIRLRAPAATVPLWVPASGNGSGFGVVDVYGLPGRLWRLGPVPGTDGAGREVTVPQGVYYVLAVSHGAARLRPEVPTDMPCGEEPTAEPGPAPEYSVPLEALTGPDGRMAVEPAYPKGC